MLQNKLQIIKSKLIITVFIDKPTFLIQLILAQHLSDFLSPESLNVCFFPKQEKSKKVRCFNVFFWNILAHQDLFINITDQKFMLQEKFDFDFHQTINVKVTPTITIGYYKLRGKAQVPRLLCEYLQIDYKDQLYTLSQWDRYKRSKTKNWDFPELPYLKQGDFVVSQPTPICIYLINRFGNPQLLGKTLAQKTIVKMYVWTIETMGNVININCQKKTPEELMELKKNQWIYNVCPRLRKYQELAKNNDWFLGYFTLIDLSIYELVRYMQLLFPGQINRFPKLLDIKNRVAIIPQINEYQQSDRAVRQTDPTTLLDELKKTKIFQQQGKS